MNNTCHAPPAEGFLTERLQKLVFEKHLNLLWDIHSLRNSVFLITYYLFEGGTQPWKLTMLP